MFRQLLSNLSGRPAKAELIAAPSTPTVAQTEEPQKVTTLGDELRALSFNHAESVRQAKAQELAAIDAEIEPIAQALVSDALPRLKEYLAPIAAAGEPDAVLVSALRKEYSMYAVSRNFQTLIQVEPIDGISYKKLADRTIDLMAAECEKLGLKVKDDRYEEVSADELVPGGRYLKVILKPN
jgi:hypothetical protein